MEACFREHTGVEVSAGCWNFRSSTAHRLKSCDTHTHTQRADQLYVTRTCFKLSAAVFTSDGEATAPTTLFLLQEEEESRKEAPSSPVTCRQQQPVTSLKHHLLRGNWVPAVWVRTLKSNSS